MKFSLKDPKLILIGALSVTLAILTAIYFLLPAADFDYSLMRKKIRFNVSAASSLVKKSPSAFDRQKAEVVKNKKVVLPDISLPEYQHPQPPKPLPF